jgi:hypothetical protein
VCFITEEQFGADSVSVLRLADKTVQVDSSTLGRFSAKWFRRGVAITKPFATRQDQSTGSILVLG